MDLKGIIHYSFKIFKERMSHVTCILFTDKPVRREHVNETFGFKLFLVLGNHSVTH